jgi:hypothetical protein
MAALATRPSITVELAALMVRRALMPPLGDIQANRRHPNPGDSWATMGPLALAALKQEEPGAPVAGMPGTHRMSPKTATEWPAEAGPSSLMGRPEGREEPRSMAQRVLMRAADRRDARAYPVR